MTVLVGTATWGGFLLHRSAAIERQTQRIQRLGGLAFQLHDFPSRAETAHGVPSALGDDYSRALDAANAELGLIAKHDGAAGRRIHGAYESYAELVTEAFGSAAANAGIVPAAQQVRLESLLGRLEARIDAEARLQEHATRVTNPQARFALIASVIAAALLIAALFWQFDMQRRSGRIDRDNVKRSEELMRQKDDFAAAVSHELRTPLTSILGYLELIDDNAPGRSSEDEAYLAVVRRNADRLLRLVSDLLLVSEVEDSMLALEVQDVDLHELANECVVAAKPAAAANGIELRLQSNGAQHTDGDRVRLAQMMDNLVSNAIKFTPEGGSVTVTTGMRDGDVVFEVADTGLGIAPADQEHLYDRFFRTRDAAVQATPGTGLGLTITKAIVEAHGGSIAVRSAVGSGTTFLVTLPAARLGAARVPSVRA